MRSRVAGIDGIKANVACDFEHAVLCADIVSGDKSGELVVAQSANVHAFRIERFPHPCLRAVALPVVKSSFTRFALMRVDC